jgi:hypothetical protein
MSSVHVCGDITQRAQTGEARVAKVRTVKFMKLHVQAHQSLVFCGMVESLTATVVAVEYMVT